MRKKLQEITDQLQNYRNLAHHADTWESGEEILDKVQQDLAGLLAEHGQAEQAGADNHRLIDAINSTIFDQTTDDHVDVVRGSDPEEVRRILVQCMREHQSVSSEGL